MLTSILLLTICYFLFRYSVAWIDYYNKTDERMPKSIWRYTCDYPVVGIRDISDLDEVKVKNNLPVELVLGSLLFPARDFVFYYQQNTMTDSQCQLFSCFSPFQN